MNSAISYLLSIDSKGIKLGLDRTIALNDSCGNPDKNLKIVQVAGTNGKGSTCAMIASGLQKTLNINVGLFTSPHLVNMNERIRINGQPISDDEIKEFVDLFKNNIEKHSASFFEATTIMAFWYFNKHNVDYAIMETGLGGRLDSVTVCNPILTVITSISMDHSEILGDTLTKIATEKAGIIKPNTPCVTIEEQPMVVSDIIAAKCKDEGADLTIVPIHNDYDISPSLIGSVQSQNARLAHLAVSTIIKNPNKDYDICKYIEQTVWYGRNQILQKDPLVVFDVAHNEAGIESFIESTKSFKFKKGRLVLSLQSRKHIQSQVSALCNSFDEIILCETNNSRTMTIDELKSYFPSNINLKCIQSDKEAIEYVMDSSHDSDFIGIIGTHHLGDAVSDFFNITFNLL